MLRQKSWRASRDNAWDNEKPSSDIFVQKWQEFLDITYAQSNAPGWFDKPQEAVKNQQDSFDKNTFDLHSDSSTQEEWMILSDLHTPFLNSSCEGSIEEYDWHQDRTHYSKQQIGEMPTWIKYQILT